MERFSLIKNIHWGQWKLISLSLLIGISLGYFIRDIFLWKKREEEYLKMIFCELHSVKCDLTKYQEDLKKVQNKVYKQNEQLSILDVNDISSVLSDDNESFYSLHQEFEEDLPDFIAKLDDLLETGKTDNYLSCYETCQANAWKFNECPEFLWRHAMIKYRSTLMIDLSDEEKRQRIVDAFSYAITAVKISPDNSNAHKWLAILYGVIGLISDIKTKILNGHKFKEHIDKCLELNPNDAYAYLLKGQFCYQVSNLAFYERQIASILFESPPTATMEEALECFNKCEELSPNCYAENHYQLHLYYKSIRDYLVSEQFLKSAKNIPLSDYQTEIKQKLATV